MLPHQISELCRNWRMCRCRFRKFALIACWYFTWLEIKRPKAVWPLVACFQICETYLGDLKFYLEMTSVRPRTKGTICHIFKMRNVGWNVKVLWPAKTLFLPLIGIRAVQRSVFMFVIFISCQGNLRIYCSQKVAWGHLRGGFCANSPRVSRNG
jgi:hypothetical protein